MLKFVDSVTFPSDDSSQPLHAIVARMLIAIAFWMHAATSTLLCGVKTLIVIKGGLRLSVWAKDLSLIF